MKSFFSKLILFIVLILLIVGIGICGLFIYRVFFEESSEPLVYKVDKIFTEEPDQEINSETEKIKTNISELVPIATKTDNNTNKAENEGSFFFYNQLDNTQKIIYDGLKKNKQYLKQGNYVINYGDVFKELLSQENGADILGNDYQSAIEAFTHDNVDIFYLDVNRMYLNIETSTKLWKTTYNVYISAAKDSNYLSDEFQSTEEIEKAITEIDQQKNAIINSLRGSDYQNILYIHDFLVNNIEYDSTFERIGSYTIYGALVSKQCVCEGYAKAFKYLANCAGYECELMQGIATNSSGERENHAWNCIKLDGIWYEVDVTWDDPIIIGGNGRISNNIKYRYYLKGNNTFQKDHSLEYQFSNNGKKFSYPNISDIDYET